MFFWRLLSAVLVLYIILISMRVLLGWLSAAAYGRPWRLLERITDPYLRLFRGLRFLRRGPFDFTPVAAVMALVAALDLASAVLLRGRFTVGILLGALVGALWAGLSFLLLLFLLLAVGRLLVLVFSRRRDSPVAGLLESLSRPAVSLARRLLPYAWLVRETHALLVAIAGLLLLRVAGGWLFHALRRLLEAIPL